MFPFPAFTPEADSQARTYNCIAAYQSFRKKPDKIWSVVVENMSRRGVSFIGSPAGDDVLNTSQQQWGNDAPMDPNVMTEQQISSLERMSVSFEKRTSYASNKVVSEQPPLVLFKTPLPYISHLDNPRSGFINTPEMHRHRIMQKLSPESHSSPVSISSPAASLSSHDSPVGKRVSLTHKGSKSSPKQVLLHPLPLHHFPTSNNGTGVRSKNESEKEIHHSSSISDERRASKNTQPRRPSFVRASVTSMTTTIPTSESKSPIVEDLTRGPLLRAPSLTRTHSISRVPMLKRQQSSIRGSFFFADSKYGVPEYHLSDPSFTHSEPYARKGIHTYFISPTEPTAYISCFTLNILLPSSLICSYDPFALFNLVNSSY